jgi:hypothetical protein
MTRLLIVHHTPSPHCAEILEAVVAGASDPAIVGVEVVRRPALTVSCSARRLRADRLAHCWHTRSAVRTRLAHPWHNGGLDSGSEDGPIGR